MAKDRSDDARDIFETVFDQPGAETLRNAAAYGIGGRVLGKAVRRAHGWKKPSRVDAKKSEDARWDRKAADKWDNAFTAYGMTYGGLVGHVKSDPTKSGWKYKERRK